MSIGRGYRGRDPAEAVALVAASRRALLLRVHRRRLRIEDLEDAYSQATLELVARARRTPFQSHAHIANALEQKFVSRIDDRRRAISGRSAIETALATAAPVDEPGAGVGQIEDRGAEVLHKVARRMELMRLREVLGDLTDDQRLVLASQVTWEMECSEFCRKYGWSPEKYRKVAQRARTRLRVLIDSHNSGERCRALEPDLTAYAARVLEPERSERVRRHLENCRPCARQLQELDGASRRVAALLPPALGATGAFGKLALGLAALRRLLPFMARRAGAHAGPAIGGASVTSGTAATGPGAMAAGAGGGVFGAGGSLIGATVTKLGVAAACVAVATGGLVICTHHRPARAHRTAATKHARIHASVPVAGSSLHAASPQAFRMAPPPGATSAHPRLRVRHAPRDFARRAVADAQARREFGSLPAGAVAAIQASKPRQSAVASTRTGSGEFGFER